MCIKRVTALLLAVLVGMAMTLLSSCGSDNSTGPDPIDSLETITDKDGNLYHIIRIGDQQWLAENLKVTQYRNGDPIAAVSNNSDWSILTTGAYCHYTGSGSNSNLYGMLYNWHAVADSRNIAPDGWHVATAEDWEKLFEYLGGAAEAGGMLKAMGTTYWKSPNFGAVDFIGFKALPSGYRYRKGDCSQISESAYFWTSTEVLVHSARSILLRYDTKEAFFYNFSKLNGFSVRCVRDKP